MRSLVLLSLLATSSPFLFAQGTAQVNGGTSVPITMNNPSMNTGGLSFTSAVGAGGATYGYIGNGIGAAIQNATSSTGFGGLFGGTPGGTVASGGTVEVFRFGNTPCIYDGPTTAGDVSVPSTTTLGQCHDQATTLQALVSCGTPIVGRVLATTTGSGQAVLTELHDVGTYGQLCNASVGTSAAFPSASIAAGGQQTITVTVNGAQVPSGATNVNNSACQASPLTDPGSNAIAFPCFVTSANTVTLYERNTGSASLGAPAITPAATSVRYKVY